MQNAILSMTRFVVTGTRDIPVCPLHGTPIERRTPAEYPLYIQCTSPGCLVRAVRGHDNLWRTTDQRLRNARMLAHSAVDCLWSHRLISRSKAYRQMSIDLGIPIEHAHMLHLSVEGCEAVTRWAVEQHAELNASSEAESTTSTTRS